MNQHLIASPEELQNAAEYLSRVDPLLAPIAKRAGLAKINPHRNYYQELVESIISQQISVKAAASILAKFRGLFPADEFPAPEAILEKSEEELRSAGLSGAKARYIQDLAVHVLDGSVNFDAIDTLSNDQIVKELTAVKGIGEWTAHMFLIFSMGRLDVLAVGDLGVRSSIMKLYGLPTIPTPGEVSELAKTRKWHPYETVACYYLWHNLDNKPVL